jgi:hypothetical protein
MASVSRQIGWSQESNLLYQILKQLTRLTSIIFGLKPKYKVFTALLTQSGGDDPLPIDTGLLTIGVTYYINNPSLGMDFTNVGAPNNNEGTYFVATGTTPSSWGANEGTSDWTLVYNTGAPVVTVLENTIGNVWFIYGGVGIYTALLPNSFDTNKIFLSFGVEVNKDNPLVERSIEIDSPFSVTNNQINFFTNSLIVNAGNLESQAENDLLLKIPIEIRVYN